MVSTDSEIKYFDAEITVDEIYKTACSLQYVFVRYNYKCQAQ
jgi:hypothetical protein